MPDTKREETMYYNCSECGKPIDQRLPKGLRGRYFHARCIDLDKVVAKALPTPNNHQRSTITRRAA
jgi:hypothetical protein